jgi:aspartate/methionine/tyrosine aminotransferase
MPRIWRLSIVSAIFLAHFAAAGAERPSLPDAQAWFGAARAWLDAAPAGTQNAAENKALSAMEGASCQPVEGALYAFPQITLPKKAVEAASQQKKAADVFYCLELLDHTGIVVVPGSGFGQKENTFHFRSTILPPEKDMDAITEKLLVFHKGFMKKYS